VLVGLATQMTFRCPLVVDQWPRKGGIPRDNHDT
jgi:hypothetical protein